MLLLIAGALLLVGVRSAGAQEPSDPTGGSTPRIRSFDSRITLNTNNSVDIVETIQYDFGSTPRHGIDRYIPFVYPWTGATPDNATYDRVTPIENLHVTATGASAATDTSEDTSGNLLVRIGDKNETVTGQHTYVISYSLLGVTNGFTDHDELPLDVVGNGWQRAIDAATGRFDLPGVASRTACFAGAAGSSAPCSSITSDGQTVTATNGLLAPGDGLTVTIALPKGVLDNPQPILRERFSLARAFSANGTTLPLGGGVALLGAAAVGTLLWRKGRDRQFAGGSVDATFGNATGAEVPVPLHDKLPDSVEFVPPDNIRPGHLGTLWDEQANDLDVTAMIIDLAVRGYLRIEEVEAPKQGSFGFGASAGDYEFVQVKPADDTLWSAERVCLQSLFQDGERARLSDLKQQFRDRLNLIEGALIDDSLAAGWFPAPPATVAARWSFLGMVILGLGAVLTWFVAKHSHYGLVVIPVPLIGLALMALASKFPRRTAKGTAMLRRIRGFKMIFDAGEGERQRWAEQKQLFSQYLPYAIVFGAAEQWAQTFESLGLTPAEMGIGVWYMSPYGYSPMSFGYAMSSFSTVTTGTIAAAAPSSVTSGGGSGFGGGGFSGGGFGGGGGGDW